MYLCMLECQVASVMFDPMDYSPPGSSVHGIPQARILEEVALPSSRLSPWPRDQSRASCLLHWQVGSLPLAPPGKTSIYVSSSVQSFSRVQLIATPWITPCQASLSITNSRSSLRLTSIESVMASSHLSLFRPLLLLPPIPPSTRVFFNESTLRMRWPKDWSFSFSIILPKKSQGWSPSEWTGWISLQSKGLPSLLQHHISKASILWRSAFFTVQLSHPYITTGKTIA